MTDQIERVAVPTRNEAGLLRALEQLEGGALGKGRWVPSYDAASDTFSMRRPNGATERGAVAYFLPSRPEVLLRIDRESGDLTGIDLTDFRQYLVGVDPSFAQAWRSWQLFHLAEHFPKFMRPYLAPRSPRKQVGPRVQTGILRGCRAG